MSFFSSMVTVWFVSVLKKLALSTDDQFFEFFLAIYGSGKLSEPEEEHDGGKGINALARPQGVILWSGFDPGYRI
jgi:hypothetical protein